MIDLKKKNVMFKRSSEHEVLKLLIDLFPKTKQGVTKIEWSEKLYCRKYYFHQ